MYTLISILEEQAKNAIEQAFNVSVIPEITQATQASFGHYQCNNAMKLGKQLRKPPIQIADMIMKSWQRLLHQNRSSLIEKMEIGGSGFINLFLSPAFLSSEVHQMVSDHRLGIPFPNPIQKIIVEFSSPNIAKELHVGHLRSTIIGDSLARLFEFLGHEVIRLNHIGDWGTQFGMLIAYLKDIQPKWGEEIENSYNQSSQTDLQLLMKWYREAKNRFDTDPCFKRKSQQEVIKLQSGDPSSKRIWETICTISRQGFQAIYNLLEVKLTERPESFYNPFLSELVLDLEQRGMITVSEGAKCLYLHGFTGRDGEPFPMLLQKTDGGYNYNTTDLAALKYRLEVDKADRIIVVTDSGQSLHFEMLFQAGEKAGYLDPLKIRLDHVAFGLVLGQDGKKFKTRSGHTEKLIDLLLESIHRAKRILSERNTHLTESELNQTAQILGIDSVKYADLSSNRIKDYLFNYDRMLRFEGNTAPFLLYAYVRIQSIKRKIGKHLPSLISAGFIHLKEPSEIALGLHIRQFGEALQIFADDLFPHRLTEYLFDLAEKFHRFFHQCRVEGSEEEDSRLILCEATGRVLHQGLEILGLKTVEKM